MSYPGSGAVSDVEGDGDDNSFDESFNVSTISHYSDGEEDANSSALPATAQTHDAHHTHSHQPPPPAQPPSEDDSEEDTPPPPPPRADRDWFADPASSYDAFVQNKLQQAGSTDAPARPSPVQPSLSEERQRLRERKSGGFGSSGELADMLAVSSQNAAAAFPSFSAVAPGKPAAAFSIPKLSLSSLNKQPSYSSGAGSASSGGSGPSASPPAANGSQTTRSRLSAFNHRLRAARKIQKFVRDRQACRPAKQEAQARRAERAAMLRAEIGYGHQQQQQTADPTRRLAFDDANQSLSTAAIPPVRKQALAHLKEKLTARGSGGGAGAGSFTARPSTAAAVVTPTAAAAAAAAATSAVAAGRARGTVVRSSSRTPSPPLPRRPTTVAARMSTPPKSTVPLRVRPFPAHAAPPLRALLQGFLVRSVLAQRPAQELLAQIRDVDVLISQLVAERSTGGKFDGPFLRSLTQQRAILKERFTALFEPPQVVPGSLAPPPSRIRFDAQAISIARSPVSPNADGSGSESRPATAGAMLKRKTVRRYLKKKENALPASSFNAPGLAK